MRPRPTAAVLLLLPLLAACAAPRPVAAPSVLPPGYVFPAEPDKASLGRFTQTQFDEFFRCHRDFITKNSSASGRTVIEFTIRPDGATEDVHLVETTLDDPPTVDCMVKSVAAWKTPFRPAGPRIFRYPFTSVAKPLEGKIVVPR